MSATSARTIEVQLKRKRTTTDHDGPLLVRFPHGPPAQLSKPDQMDDITFSLYAHPEERKAFQRILVAETPGVTYAAQNFGSQQSYKTNGNQYAIGIFDATKSKVKIVSCNHVYKMDQHVHALDHMDVSKPSESSDSFQTKQRVLADTFGSKKTQKRLASRAANEVTVQESTSQVLTHAVSTIQPNEMEAEASLLENIHQTVLPRYDETVEDVRKIYAIDSIAPDSVMDALGPVLKAWRNVVKKGSSGIKKDYKSETPLSKYAFVQNRLEALALLDNDQRDSQLKLLIYFNLLLNFRNSGKNKRKVVAEWDTTTVAPERVKEQLLMDFTTSKTGADGLQHVAFDSQCEQKLLCYIAVTSLILCHFTLDAEQIDAIATDLKMMTSDMFKYYLESGCTVSKTKIQLHAPLKLPKLRKKIERK